jgi:hypothetical protein
VSTPRCELCSTKDGVLTLRNKAQICRPCRRKLRRLLAPVGPGKPVCKVRAKPRRGPMRDPKYRAWCRERVCAITLVYGSLIASVVQDDAAICSPGPPNDPAHTQNNGMASKGPDSSCAPLCRKHHAEYDSGRDAFEKKYGVDMKKIAAEHYAKYIAECAAVSE